MPRISKVELQTLRQQVNLVSLVGRTVKLTKNGPDYFGLCPFHQEKSPSFSVNPSKGFYHCFGCGAHGDALDWVMAIDGVDFPTAVSRLRIEAGEFQGTVEPDRLQQPKDADDRRMRLARSIWDESKPITGTNAERYLHRARHIGIELPDCLRFHPELKTQPGLNAKRYQAMVAAISDPTGKVIAIQRTFLRPDGNGKASIENAKRALGSRGNGAVRLGDPAPITGIAEGIETGLSAMELFGLPVWCGLGSTLSKIWLPANVNRVVIFADRGEAGIKAAKLASQEFRAQGRKVAIRFPQIGDDFNDELIAKKTGKCSSGS